MGRWKCPFGRVRNCQGFRIERGQMRPPTTSELSNHFHGTGRPAQQAGGTPCHPAERLILTQSAGRSAPATTMTRLVHTGNEPPLGIRQGRYPIGGAFVARKEWPRFRRSLLPLPLMCAWESPAWAWSIKNCLAWSPGRIGDIRHRVRPTTVSPAGRH